MLAGMYRGPGKAVVAWNSALLYDMIFTQPVVYELGALTMPTLLMIGDHDTTAIGKDVASPEVRAKIGHYPELAKLAVQSIPDAKLVEFADLGHSPQLQDPAAFHAALLGWLCAVAPTLPSPCPLPQAGEGSLASPLPRSGRGALASPLQQAGEGSLASPLPRSGRGAGG